MLLLVLVMISCVQLLFLQVLVQPGAAPYDLARAMIAFGTRRACIVQPDASVSHQFLQPLAEHFKKDSDYMDHEAVRTLSQRARSHVLSCTHTFACMHIPRCT